jgi:hypothetical protein
VGWDGATGNDKWRIEKRLLSTGNTVIHYPVIFDPQPNQSDRANAVCLDLDVVFAGGYESPGGTKHWRIERRGKIDGVLLCILPPTGAPGEVTRMHLTLATPIYAAGNHDAARKHRLMVRAWLEH